ncbi:MAG: filamentous hemagglutinin N-terminal domain-containing protein [Candidatus Sedimenticola endophacoides]
MMVSGNRLTVQQQSDRLIAQWATFDIGREASVHFQQPASSSVALNRVQSMEASRIYGQPSVNGQLFLVNPAGVLFGPGGRFDGGALVASTLGISDADFLSGDYRFYNDGRSAALRNAGTLTANGGYIALLALHLENSGTLRADQGSVALIAADRVSLDFTGDGLIQYTVEQGAVDAQIDNGGLIRADNGVVVLNAEAAYALTRSVVNNSGIVRASGVSTEGGRILLVAGGGEATVSGTLDASSDTDAGGRVLVTGDRVEIGEGAHLNASGASGGGEVLVGGSWQNSGPGIDQATSSRVAAGARLEASAVGQGDGGTVVVWSDIHDPGSVTEVHGELLARGGILGGDGGRIETSGHRLVVAGITADASAPDGRSGEWLLDPYSITIDDGGTTTPGSSALPDYESSATSTIDRDDIEAQLDGGTSVTVQTGGTLGDGQGDGDISVTADILKAAGGDATLTLKAHNDITLDGVTISSSSSALNLVLWSRHEGGGQGQIDITGSTITTNGGHFRASGGPETTWNSLSVGSDKG